MDTLKDSAKKGMHTVSTGAKALGTNVANEIKRRQAYSKAQRRILDKLDMAQLKGICKFYGIGEPSPYEEDINGKRYKIKLTRTHYLNYTLRRLSLEQIKNFAEKNRIQVYDIVNEYRREIETIQERSNKYDVKQNFKDIPEEEDEITEPKSKVTVQNASDTRLGSINSDFEEILLGIKNKYQNMIAQQVFADESQFNNNLYTFLMTQYGDRMRIENKYSMHREGDIQINGQYVLELKYADNKGTLALGVTELKQYKDRGFLDMAVIILDVGQMSGAAIQEYKRYYEQEGAKVIILNARGKRKKKAKYVITKI